MSNTRLDNTFEVARDQIVRLFKASPYFTACGALPYLIAMFVTDQDGPIRGVVTDENLAELVTAIQNEVSPSGGAGEEPQ